MSDIVLVVGANYPTYKYVTGEGTKTVWKVAGFPNKLLTAGQWRRMAIAYARHSSRLNRFRRSPDRPFYTLIDCFRGTIDSFKEIRGSNPLLLDTRTFDPPLISSYRLLKGAASEDSAQLLPLRKERVTAPNARVLYFPGLTDDRSTTVAEYKQLVLDAQRENRVIERSLGVLNVYGLLSQLENGALQELHFFSHGTRHGPILLNTPEFVVDPKVKSVLDKDGREKDFAILQQRFKLADKFARDAFSVIWGCSADANIDLLIKTCVTETAGDPTGTTKHCKIVFSGDRYASPDVVQQEQDEFIRFWRAQPTPANLTRELTRMEFADIFKHSVIPATYAKQLAISSNRPVFGALPGTSANYDDTQGFFPLTHVPQGRREDTDGKGHLLNLVYVLDFYKANLRITFDLRRAAQLPDSSAAFHKEFGRGFARYSP